MSATEFRLAVPNSRVVTPVTALTFLVRHFLVGCTHRHHQLSGTLFSTPDEVPDVVLELDLARRAVTMREDDTDPFVRDALRTFDDDEEARVEVELGRMLDEV